MNTQSNAITEATLDRRVIVRAVIPLGRRMYWLVRRELWENRSLYVAPIAVAGLFLVGFLIGTIQLPGKLRAASGLSPGQRHELIAEPYSLAALLIMAATFIVAIFYCLDALQGERRDRSILFWKSLPVSDLATVLSKASIPMVVLPLLALAMTVATHWLMLVVSSAVLLASGHSLASLWTHLSLVQMWLMLLYHYLTIHALWYAPIYAWLLLVSGWARRAAVLWAALPLLAIGVFEKLAFNTSHFAALLQYRMTGGPEGGDFTTGMVAMHPLTHLTPGKFLGSPGLWIGLAMVVIFLAAAARLRRHRGPI